MKKYLLISLVLISFFSCKKKYEVDYLGPQGKEEISFVALKPLNSNVSEVDFTSGSMFFTGLFDKSITWKLTIEGTISGATKTFTGTSASIDSTLAKWRGEQDSLYYFINEPCTVTLSDYYPVSGTLYDNISYNSNVRSPSIKLVQTLNIVIKNPKNTDSRMFPLFPNKFATSSYSLLGLNAVAYDSEQCPDGAGLESSNEVRTDINDPLSVSILSNSYLPFSKKGGPINRRSLNRRDIPVISDYYYILKGQDTYNYDYYIGRVEVQLDSSEGSVTRKPTKYLRDKKPSPDSVWFNVFIYGNGDGSKCNYTIKEDDSPNSNELKQCGIPAKGYDGKGDDSFEKAITIDFIGWKLFSFKYSDFDAIKDGPNGNGSGDKNPDKIAFIQFSLVASNQGGTAQVIFDYPTMTIGGPLKY